MIKLTVNAASKIKTLLENDTNQNIGIRAYVRGGGCSGFTYKLELISNSLPKDKIIKSHGVDVYVDPKSFLYLMGSEIDYIDDLNNSGFKFSNPNARRTCGCGESFSI